jgi:glycosyltransferase involved in cell wall biosynthesis
LRQPRVAYIAFYFPPSRASGVYRAVATAQAFNATSWDVTVFTPQRSLFTECLGSYDNSLDAEVPPEAQVERVRFPARRWCRDIREFSRFRGNFPAWSDRLNSWAEDIVFPEHYSPWIPRVLRAVLREHHRKHFDLILATGNPFSSFAAAWLVHRMTGVPYVVDYRDSWTLDLFSEQPAFPPSSTAYRWERRILRDCERALFVNEPLRQWHQHRYEESATKMHVVANGWDPQQISAIRPPRPTSGRLRFGYVGTVTPNVPIESFLSGWTLAQTLEHTRGSVATLYGHLGFFPGSVAPLKARLAQADETVTLGGPVPKSAIADVYNSIDVLLLILAGGRFVTSGKVYEYMATGRPIVSIHDPRSAATEILSGYPLWFPAHSLEPIDVAHAIENASRAARSLSDESFAAAQRYSTPFSRSSQIEPLARDLAGIVAARRIGTR